MVSESDIQAMEEIIVEHAGPLGKFVIKKVITDLGSEPKNYDEETVYKFITVVLERSIYDTTKWNSVRREILEAWKESPPARLA